MSTQNHAEAALEFVREQIEHKRSIGEDPGALIVDAYVLTHADLLGIAPYKHLDQFVKHCIRRGDIWAEKEAPTIQWSYENGDYEVKEKSHVMVVIETELDVSQATIHGHNFAQPGEFKPDLSEVDIIIAANDEHGKAARLRRQGVPLIVLEEWDDAPDFEEFKFHEGWRE